MFFSMFYYNLMKATAQVWYRFRRGCSKRWPTQNLWHRCIPFYRLLHKDYYVIFYKIWDKELMLPSAKYTNTSPFFHKTLHLIEVSFLCYLSETSVRRFHQDSYVKKITIILFKYCQVVRALLLPRCSTKMLTSLSGHNQIFETVFLSHR